MRVTLQNAFGQRETEDRTLEASQADTLHEFSR